jgi:hypothetical protein
MEDISERHVTQGLVIPVEVVVFNEIGDGPLQLTREFIKDLVHLPPEPLQHNTDLLLRGVFAPGCHSNPGCMKPLVS